LLPTTSSETERSDNDRKFVAFGTKNTGISLINGLDDLCQGWPSKAKDFGSRKAKAKAQILTLRPRPRTNITDICAGIVTDCRMKIHALS